MKKTIYLLLVFLCILTLTSCSKMKKDNAVSKNDALEFLRQNGLYTVTEFDDNYELADKKYDYEFTVKIKEKRTTLYNCNSLKVNAKGRASLEIKEETPYLEYYVKGSLITSLKFATISEKQSLNTIIKEEVYMIQTNDGDELCYINQKTHNKSTNENYKKETKIKSSYAKGKLDDYVPIFEETLKDILNKDVYAFIEGKKCTIVYSDAVSKSTIEMWFDDEEITKLKETREAYDGKYVSELKFKDIDSIDRPENPSDYENIDRN